MIFNQPTTGAGNDIERATGLARKMVCEWGMSEKLGPLAFGKKEEMIFLGREIARHSDYSEATAREIDAEVRRLVTEGHDKANEICSQHKDQQERLALALLEHESLSADHIDKVMKGEKIEVPKTDTPSGSEGEKAEKKEKGEKKTKKVSSKPATDIV